MNRMISLLAIVALLAGCAVGPDYRLPQMPVPDGWAGTTATNAPVALSTWWQTFNDPELTALMVEALVTNLDVQLAEARLRQSRAARAVAAGGLWPAVNGSTSYQRARTPANGTTPPQKENVYLAGFDAIWELDIFGGIRRNVEAANASIKAAQEGLRDAQVSLAAEVALSYIQLRGF